MATKKIKGSLSVENVLELPNTTAYPVDTVLTVNSSGEAQSSAVTTTELGHLDGVTSAIQTQIDGKTDSSDLGVANGIATLDAGGKVPASQLPNSVMEYKGTWAASTNTPSLSDGAGNAGDVYIASDAGTVDFGSGNITFAAGDWVIYNGSTWEKSVNSNAVASVNTKTGAVVLVAADLNYTQATPANWTVADASSIKATLDEVGSRLSTNESNFSGHTDGSANKHDATEIDYERVDGSKKNIQAASDDVELALTDLDDAIGSMSQGSNYTAASVGIVASHLSAIDTALASAGGSTFEDITFRIFDDIDNTKQIAFQCDQIATGQTRTITMTNENVDLADVVTAIQPSDNISSLTNDSNFVDAAGVRSTALTGLSLADSSDVVATDTVLQGFGKLQAQVDSLSAGAASSLDDLSDVTITTPSSGQILKYDNNAGVFENITPTGSAGAVVTSDDLAFNISIDINSQTDLGAASDQPTSDELLIYDASGTANKKVSVKNLTGRAVGDIHETEFTLPTGNLATTATNLTGLSFSNTNVRSFEAQVIFEASTDTASGGSVEVYRILGVSRSLAGEAATWDIAVESVGDNVDVTFSITTSGQLQYAFPSATALPSGTYDSDSGNFRFRASTISTAAGQSV